MEETGSGEPSGEVAQPKLLMRDPVFEKQIDDAFFAQLLDGIGSIKKLDERDKSLKLR